VRVLPGKYTVRLTNDQQVAEAELVVAPDARTKWTDADRKTRWDAAMRMYELFGNESRLFDQITATRMAVSDRRAQANAPIAALDPFDKQLDEIRKEIVATKEGGAITGEERLREHTDQLYDALLSWDGPPTAYQLTAIDTLTLELGELRGRFDGLMVKERAALNGALKAAGIPEIDVPSVEEQKPTSGGSGGVPPQEHDQDGGLLEDFRPFY
jgi:hypothetical protein